MYLISGGYDLLVTLEGKTLKEVSKFVSEKLSILDPVISTATHFILKKYKDHGTLHFFHLVYNCYLIDAKNDCKLTQINSAILFYD